MRRTSPHSAPRPRRRGRLRPLQLLAVSLAALAASVLGQAAVPAQVNGGSAAAAAARPNIIVVVTDDQTMDAVAKMPYVSSRKDWVRFRQAYVQNAMCCPSRATILTGRYDTHTRVQNNGQTGRFDASRTMAVWLRNAGYRTALVGKYLNNYPSAFSSSGYPVPPGWDEFHAVVDPNKGTYGQYEWDLASNGSVRHYGSEPQDYQVDVLASRAQAAIEAAGTEPFFLYFAPTATHAPWVASPRRTGMFDSAPTSTKPALFNEPDVTDKPEYVRLSPLHDPTQMAADRRAQWAASVSVDDAIRSLDAKLRAEGKYDDTVLIVIGDNGYSFGEHRLYGKACQYAVCNRVPLLVRWPGHPARTVTKMVSNVDVASTVAALAGVRPGAGQDGRSLVPLLEGRTTPWRTGVLLHWPGHLVRDPGGLGYVAEFWGVRTARHLYVELPDTGERELYDLVADPDELRNLAGQPAYSAVQSQLQRQLATLKAAALS